MTKFNINSTVNNLVSKEEADYLQHMDKLFSEITFSDKRDENLIFTDELELYWSFLQGEFD